MGEGNFCGAPGAGAKVFRNTVRVDKEARQVQIQTVLSFVLHEARMDGLAAKQRRPFICLLESYWLCLDLTSHDLKFFLNPLQRYHPRI